MSRRASKTPWMLIGMVAGAIVSQCIVPAVGGSAFDHIAKPFAYLFVGCFVGATIGLAIGVIGNRPDDRPPVG